MKESTESTIYEVYPEVTVWGICIIKHVDTLMKEVNRWMKESTESTVKCELDRGICINKTRK